MKALLVITIASLLSTQSFAENSDTPAIVSELSTLHLDPNQFEKPASSAIVKIDEAQNEISLSISFQQNCQQGQGRYACRTIIPTEVITLPLVGVSKDGCGATIYIAERDERSNDGSLEQIEITDQSTNVCRVKLSANEVTVVKHSLIHEGRKGTFATQSVLKGNVLSQEVLYKKPLFLEQASLQ